MKAEVAYTVENCPKKCRDCLIKECDFKNQLAGIFEQIEQGNWNENKLQQMIKFQVVRHSKRSKE